MDDLLRSGAETAPAARGGATLPRALSDAAAARAPVSLYYSLPSVLPRVAFAVAILVYGRYSSVTILGILGAMLLLSFAATTKRIDLDTSNLTFVPLIPLLPRQRLPIADVGPIVKLDSFGYRNSPYTIVRANLADARYRTMWVYPTHTLKLALTWGASYRSPSLSYEQFAALVDAYRPWSSGRPDSR